MTLPCQKHLFRLPEEVTYLNCAYQAPLMRHIEVIGHRKLSEKCLPHTRKGSDFFVPVTHLRQQFAQLINADDFQRIAIIPAASYGVATVAHNIKLTTTDNVVVLEEQFPSNIYSWRRLTKRFGATLKMIKAPDTQDNRGQKWNEDLLAAIDEQTKLVAVPHVQWADGTLFDLAAIRAKTRQVGALMILDATQSVGALPFDVQQLQPDALICAGYKWLMGGYGLGLAYYGAAFDGGIPIEENWINRLDSDNFSQLVNYQEAYQPKATRYCVGEQSNFIHVTMLSAALEQLLEWGVENIQTYCAALTAEPLQELKELGCWVEDANARSSHLFGVRIGKGLEMKELKQKLADNQVYVSQRGNALRISPHVYNTAEDMEKLIECFKKLKKVSF